MSYSGPAAGIFTLPAAVVGNGNFIGRIYRIKNNAGLALTLLAATGERISNLTSITIDSGSTAEIISTGSTTGTTWEIASLFKLQPSDNIRAAFSAVGCASCATYDTAATNTWVSITATEYNSLFSLSGIRSVGATTAQLNQQNSTVFSSSSTFSQNSLSLRLPAASFPVAMVVRTGYNTNPFIGGLKLKLSSTAQTSGYVDYPSSSATTPNAPFAIVANTLYYFVIKKPSTTSAFGQPSYIGFYQPSPVMLDFLSGTGGTVYYDGGDISNPTIAIPSLTPQFQVLATPNKLW